MSWKRKLVTVKSLKADVSSVSPSSERLGNFVGLFAENGAMLLVGIWWRENKNKLVEWKALVDTVAIKSADLEDEFLFWSFAAFRTAYIHAVRKAANHGTNERYH